MLESPPLFVIDTIMHASDHHFTRFIAAIDTLPLPERFTFPFCYTPHPLCVLAAQELQQHIATQHHWQHNFGLGNDDAIGHMFGVLLVQNQQGEIGYLSAFSEKIANQTHLPHFVPPVFDDRNIDPAIKAQQALIDEVTTKITAIESNPSYIQLQHQYQVAQDHAELASESFRLQMIEQRKQRKLQRVTAEKSNDSEFMTQEFHRLARESAFDKHQQKAIRQQWTQTLSEISDKLQADTATLTLLKAEYETLTALLQQHRYAQYQFLNQDGKIKDLNALFRDQTPPQGAGDCAAVKLLQYAFKQHLTPLAMAKFWWGASPAAQIRKHKYFYEACKNKCEPILQHMLAGLDIDANPLLQNPAEGKELEIVYQDDAMVVINKPAEFLSVPGKTITDSVYSRMQTMFPNSNSPLIVHRLDMATSGLIVIALTKDTHKALQQQFINRTAEKRYMALLDGIVEQDCGEINLPMRVDLDDRPRQLVCYEYGKPALTKWQVLERKDGKTKVYYYPKTGRTHQLRIHSAHKNGMNMPIVGDDLYGQKANRLHLHAQYLGLTHPVTGEPMIFEIDADF